VISWLAVPVVASRAASPDWQGLVVVGAATTGAGGLVVVVVVGLAVVVLDVTGVVDVVVMVVVDEDVVVGARRPPSVTVGAFTVAAAQPHSRRLAVDTRATRRRYGDAPPLAPDVDRHRCRRLGAVAAVLMVAALAGCGPGSSAAHRRLGATASASDTTTRASTSSTASTSSIPSTSTTTMQPFVSTVSAVTTTQLGATWHPGCPVDPSQLRAVQLRYWGFEGQSHTGTIVVNASVVPAVIQVFQTLYAERFPIHEIVPQSAFGGDDNAAAAADDTSGFNCRLAVAPGPPQWSVHAYGEAIDVNDVENPYVDGSTVIPPAGAAYEDRSDIRPGMAVPGGPLVEAFAAVGWQWGGRWTSDPDYQHFSATGG
jgi:hypothetical protein